MTDENQIRLKLQDICYGNASMNMTPEACTAQATRITDAVLEQCEVRLRASVELMTVKKFAGHEIAEDRIEEALEFAIGFLNTIAGSAATASSSQLGALARAGLDLARSSNNTIRGVAPTTDRPYGEVMDEMDHQAKYQSATVDPGRDQELRIQALGAAISRRDWHAVEIAYGAIRDKFYDPQTTPST
jgi:hypothetical protein